MAEVMGSLHLGGDGLLCLAATWVRAEGEHAGESELP